MLTDLEISLWLIVVYISGSQTSRSWLRLMVPLADTSFWKTQCEYGKKTPAFYSVHFITFKFLNIWIGPWLLIMLSSIFSKMGLTAVEQVMWGILK